VQMPDLQDGAGRRLATGGAAQAPSWRTTTEVMRSWANREREEVDEA